MTLSLYWTRWQMSSQRSSEWSRSDKPRSNFSMPVMTRAAAFSTRWCLSVINRGRQAVISWVVVSIAVQSNCSTVKWKSCLSCQNFPLSLQPRLQLQQTTSLFLFHRNPDFLTWHFTKTENVKKLQTSITSVNTNVQCNYDACVTKYLQNTRSNV